MSSSADEHRRLRIKILDALNTPERRLWLDPEDADLIAEDIARAVAPSSPPTVEQAPWLRDPHAP